MDRRRIAPPGVEKQSPRPNGNGDVPHVEETAAARHEAAANPTAGAAGDGDERQARRDRLGRFETGTVGGPGNPFGRQVARNRRILLAAFTDERVEALVDKLFEMALEGDLGAIKILLQYLVGKPLPAVNPDRVNHEEWEMRREQPHVEEVAMHTQSQLPHPVVLLMQRFGDEGKLRKLQEQFGRSIAARNEADAKQAARAARRARRKDERRRRKHGG
jgi:hypothetical protein